MELLVATSLYDSRGIETGLGKNDQILYNQAENIPRHSKALREVWVQVSFVFDFLPMLDILLFLFCFLHRLRLR